MSPSKIKMSFWSSKTKCTFTLTMYGFSAIQIRTTKNQTTTVLRLKLNNIREVNICVF